jgi:hypothetical protein
VEVVGHGTTTYTLDYAAGDRILAEEAGGSTTLYLYGRDCLGEQRGGEWLYYLPDAEGYVRQGTDAQGNVASTWLFDPDGTLLEGPEGPVNHLVCGGVYDSSTGLIYRDGRYFDPLLGIWLALMPLIVVQSWKRRKKGRGWSWCSLLLLGICLTGVLTGCKEPTEEDLEQICVEAPYEPQGRCHITEHTIIRDEIISDPDQGFYKDFIAGFCGNPDDLQQCFFVQWIKGTMGGKNAMGDPVGDNINLPDWDVDTPGGYRELGPNEDPRVPLNHYYEWPDGNSRYLLQITDSAWVFNDIPGCNYECTPLVTGGEYWADAEFRLNVYDESDFPGGPKRQDFHNPNDPPPIYSVSWAFQAGPYTP